MKYKKNAGVTLIALTVTIIVIFIIAGITIYSGSNLIQQSKVEDVKTNMLLLQAEVKNYIEQAKFENKKIEDVVSNGIKVSEDGLTLRIEADQEIQGTTFYKIISPTMSELKLKNINAEQYILAIDIDSVTVEVYYKPGVRDGHGTVYNFLSEMP